MGMSNRGISLLCLGLAGLCTAGSFAAKALDDKAKQNMLEDKIAERVTKNMLDAANDSSTTIKK